MTGSPRSGPRQVRSRPVRDPYGLLPAGTPVAPILAAVGLVLIAIVTLGLTNGQLPFVTGNGGPNASGGGGGVSKTPTPSGEVVVPPDPRAEVPGTIVYAKDGNIWVQSGKSAHQLTSSGTDDMPSFSPDGRFVYFVRTRFELGLWPASGSNRTYRMDIPSVMRVPADGSGDPVRVIDGKVDGAGRLRWMGWLRQPTLSPDGKTLAVLSDLPDPTRSDVVLQLYNLQTKKLKSLKLGEVAPLGHQDPAWRPDGKSLLYVRNNRDGASGTPQIWLYNISTSRARSWSGPGYLHPAWSRDAQWVAATRTTPFGTDVVIMRASDGAEVLRVTDDGHSWAPVWSPKGDALVFLHVEGQVVDLRMVTLTGTGPSWTLGEPLDLTENAGLDSVSRPGWFIPADQLPATPAPPTTAPGSGAGASPSGS